VSGFAGWISDTQNAILDKIISFTGEVAKNTALSLIPALLASLFTEGIGGLPELVQVLQKVGEFGELVGVIEAIDVVAAGRLASGILVVATNANTAMTAAMSSTPNPNVDPASPQSTPNAPSDDQAVQSAENAVNRGNMPDLKITRQQLEKKFKHAADLGVTTPRGTQGFSDFQDALNNFVDDPATVRTYGTYRGDPAILNYDAATRQVVIQNPDGSFLSNWKMSPQQTENVVQRGSL
jgi:hypothetical protein